MSRIVRASKVPEMPAATGWMDAAACRTAGVDPELWWPVAQNHRSTPEEVHAKSICGRCPVLAQCAALAAESGQESGIWAGVNLNHYAGRAARVEALNHAAGVALQGGVSARV